jgi:hypothetical protein
VYDDRERLRVAVLVMFAAAVTTGEELPRAAVEAAVRVERR